MSSDRVLDYLTEELVVEKNIVTYRSLSHALKLHVNQAKNELAVYHSEHAGSSDAGYATYIIGGEPCVSYLDSIRDTDKMAIDGEEMDEDSEDVPETKITLVREADLETSKEQYTCIHFVHIYSLSPSPIHEPALLCETAKNLRDAGKNIADGFTVTQGRITGPDYIKKRTDLQQRRSSSKAKSSTIATSSSSKNRLPGLSKAPSMAEDAKPVVKSEPKDVKPLIKEEPAKPVKPSGKLDFSKAKAKPAAAPAPKPAPETRKIKAEPVEEPPQAASSKAPPKPEHKPSRTKDKSMSKLSDSEEEESATAPTRAKSSSMSKRTESTKSSTRASRRVVISDDDEDEDAPKPSPPPRAKAAYKSKAKAKTKTKDASPDDPEAEKELRAMMDIDDDQVTRVSHAPVLISEPATTPPATDVEMEDREPEPEPEPARAPTRKNRRKPKKEVPMGRNGLKKRRVVKSRMTTDEKGYFVTEDYSSYESVDDEEEAPAEKPAKGKGKKRTASVKVKEEAEAEEAKELKEKAAKPLAKSASTLKRKPSKPNVQKGGGIASYFNKK